MMNIAFIPMQETHLPLWESWVQKPHIRAVWFMEGCAPETYIRQKITGNGYAYPFIISLEQKSIGYIQCTDLYAYRNKCINPMGLFSHETPGTFGIDLFIADEANLNKGYGTEIIKAFTRYIFIHFHAIKILIDPASTNLRAIRCYEKAGFKKVRKAFAGNTTCAILEYNKYQTTEALKENLIALYATAGKEWLKNLPLFLAQCESEWQLSLMPCYSNANFNYVAPAILANNKNAVLKCSLDYQALAKETAALQHFSANGSVKLLREDIASGKILLEEIIPGESLEKFNYTKKGVQISIEIIQKLHKPITNHATFPTLQEWFQGFALLRKTFNGNTGPFPLTIIDRAEQISKTLLSSMGEQVLLHGDLHYGNILYSKTRGWLAIDPKGVIGEREFEIPLPKLNETFDKKLLESTLKYFLEISGFDPQRIFAWLFSKAVLAAWWTYEDQKEIDERFLYYAKIIQGLGKL